MSTGLFLSIKESYSEESQNSAENLIDEINLILELKGIPKYLDPIKSPDIYNGNFFGKSGLDHHSSNVLFKLGVLANDKIRSKHLKLLSLNPYRVVFLPFDFKNPFQTNHKELFWNQEEAKINVGSSNQLLNELKELATEFGISPNNQDIFNQQINNINDLIPFNEKDTPEVIEDYRSAWLLMFEGARLSIENKVALSLAG